MARVPSGVEGFDELICGGVLPGQLVLLEGGPGTGKTLFGLRWAATAAAAGNKASVVHFEELVEGVLCNGKAIGLDLETLIASGQLVIDSTVTSDETVVLENYTFDALVMRITAAVETHGATLLVLDTLDSLYGQFSNATSVRSALNRVFNWLRAHGITTIVTGEIHERQPAQLDIAAYVADVVIRLDHRVSNDVTTRRLRIVKARGMSHGYNEYPFIIDERGIVMAPVTSIQLNNSVVQSYYTTGSEKLDAILGGKGLRRNSTVLISGGPGSGKTILGAMIASSSVLRQERVMVFSFEESPDEYVINTAAAGSALGEARHSNLCTIVSTRPTFWGIEKHLIEMSRAINDFAPEVVVIDPISSLKSAGSLEHVHHMLVRMIDFLKSRSISAVLVSAQSDDYLRTLDTDIASIVDTWIHLWMELKRDESTRRLRVIKARGQNHQEGSYDFSISDRGVEID